MLASATLDRHLTYVAMTRHRDAAQLYVDGVEFGLSGPAEAGAALPHQFVARLSRAGTKETTLDYAPVFAARRGIAERFGLGSTIALEPHGAKEATTQVRRGMFAGLRLSRTGPAGVPVTPPPRGPFAGLKLRPGGVTPPEPVLAPMSRPEPTNAAGRVPDPGVTRIPAASGFEAALGRYLRAGDARERQVGAGLPILEGQARELSAATAALETRVLKARTWLLWMYEDRNRLAFVGVAAGVAGLYFGAMAVFLVPNLLPFGAAEYVASRILGEKSWQAGIRLMEFENPLGVSRLETADRLMRANDMVIEACRAVVAKTGKSQPCTITVAAPGH